MLVLEAEIGLIFMINPELQRFMVLSPIEITTLFFVNASSKPDYRTSTSSYPSVSKIWMEKVYMEENRRRVDGSRKEKLTP